MRATALVVLVAGFTALQGCNGGSAPKTQQEVTATEATPVGNTPATIIVKTMDVAHQRYAQIWAQSPAQPSLAQGDRIEFNIPWGGGLRFEQLQFNTSQPVDWRSDTTNTHTSVNVTGLDVFVVSAWLVKEDGTQTHLVHEGVVVAAPSTGGEVAIIVPLPPQKIHWYSW